jgi:2-polyprenyl-3-methyl-5-hydroxy-6-metoxy-1,4-benzoquinol methylase
MLISEEYREIQRKLHADNRHYGSASTLYGKSISSVIHQLKATDILDYGAGKGRLKSSLDVEHEIQVSLYDPAIKLISRTPDPHEFVACIDVLEHIEPEYLDEVLDDLKRVTKDFGFFSVSTAEAKKTLSDGRNAHLIVEPMEWWLPKIMSRFSLKTLSVIKNQFWVVVYAKD